MDFQSFVDCVGMPCCVMSVEKAEDGGHGEIRIICANSVYKEIMGPAYYDNMIYSELVPQDNKFEDYCYQAAVLGKRMHAYVETRALKTWTDQTLIPLESDSENMGYCQFIFEFTREAEADRMASVSVNVASAVIKACIQLMGSENFNISAGKAVDVIREAAGATAARIMLIDHEKKAAINFCERADDADWPERDYEHDVITYEVICSWESMIGVSNAIIISDQKDLCELEKINPEWIGSMRIHGVTSLVLIPLRQGKTVIGYLYVVNFDVSRLAEVKELVELMSYFLGSEISNHLLLKQLKRISSIDVLTGMNNRRAMISRIRQLSECKPVPSFGVINIDLNGLKYVNDRDGHEAGDRLLEMTAEILQKYFYQDDLYRTGGDEFIVVVSDIEETVFERKVQRLHNAMFKHDSVSFAMGACWSDGSVDINTVFRYADEKMYADKEAYYRKNPNYRRK